MNQNDKRGDKHNMRKKELTLAVIERLKQEYPEAGCTLDYNEAWKLLVSVRLHEAIERGARRAGAG